MGVEEGAEQGCGMLSQYTGKNLRAVREPAVADHIPLTDYSMMLTTGVELCRETFDTLRFASNAASGVPPTDLFNPNPGQSAAGATKTLAAKSDTTSVGFGIFAA